MERLGFGGSVYVVVRYKPKFNWHKSLYTRIDENVDNIVYRDLCFKERLDMKRVFAAAGIVLGAMSVVILSGFLFDDDYYELERNDDDNYDEYGRNLEESDIWEDDDIV